MKYLNVLITLLLSGISVSAYGINLDVCHRLILSGQDSEENVLQDGWGDRADLMGPEQQGQTMTPVLYSSYDAAQYREEMKKNDPSYSEKNSLLSYQYYNKALEILMSAPEKAKQNLDLAIGADPDFPMSYIIKAWIEGNIFSDFQGAWALLEKAEQASKKYKGKDELHIALIKEVQSDVLLLQDRRTEALDYIDQSIKIVLKESGKNNDFYATLVEEKGDVYKKQGDFKSALSLYNEAEAILKSLNKTKDKNYAGLMLSMGLCYDALGHSHQTDLYIKKSESIHSKLKSKNDYTMASYYENIAFLYYNKDDLKNAQEYLDKSKEVYQEYKLQKTISYASILSLEANILLRNKKISESEKIYNVSLKIQKDLGLENSTMYARTLVSLGNIQEESNLKEANKYFLQARDILVKNKKTISDDYVMVLQRLANIETKAPVALKYYSEAKAVLEKLDLIDSKQYSILLYNMAYTYSIQDDYKNALQYFQESLSVMEKNKLDDTKLRVGLYISIASTYADLEDYKQSVKMYQQAVALTEKVEQRAELEFQLAQLYDKRLGDYVTALAYYKSSLADFESSKDTSNEKYASALMDCGRIYTRTDNAKLGFSMLMSAEALYKKTKWDSDGLEWTVYYLADAYKDHKLFPQAEAKYLELLSLIKNSPDLNNLKLDACLSLGNIAYDKKEEAAAIKYYKQTMDLLDKNASDYADLSINLQTRLSYISMDKKEYKEALDSMNKVIEIFNTYKVKDPETLANTYLNMGYAWSQIDEPAKAITEYLNCKNILEKEKLKDRKIYKMVLNNLAASYHNSGDMDNARKYQEMAEKI